MSEKRGNHATSIRPDPTGHAEDIRVGHGKPLEVEAVKQDEKDGDIALAGKPARADVVDDARE